jgi:F-type H+-transporting ATPase subunit b
MRRVLIATVLVLLPAVALASGDGAAAGPDFAGILRHLINLAVLLGVIYLAARGPFGDFLRFRRTEVVAQLEAAEKAREEAEARAAELQERVDGFEAELATLVAMVKTEAEAEHTSIVEQARAAAVVIERGAQSTMDEELRRARTALRAEAVELAVQMAETTIKAQVDKADQSRLTKTYIQQAGELS